MTPSRFDRFLPLAGVLAGLAFAAGLLLTASAPDGTDTAELTAWGAAHQTRALLAAATLGYAAVLLAFFATAARQAVRSGEPGESTYSSAVFAGGLMVAVAAGVWSFLSVALASAIDNGDKAAVATLGYLTSFAWLPWLVGSVVLFLSLGLGGLRTACLPRWLAYLTLALGVLGLTGVGGFAVYLAMPVWLVVAGVVLHGRLTQRGPTVGASDQVTAGV